MGKKGRGRKFFLIWALILLGFAAGVIFGVYFAGKSGPEKVAVKEGEKPVAKLIPPQVNIPEKPLEIEVARAPRVAIVIDDMGQDMKKLNELFKVDAPITVAVLPHLRYSKKVAVEAHFKKGWEVILHLPMEPKPHGSNGENGGISPGEGALFTNMSAEAVRAQVEDDLKDVPYAIGVNNHMGSRFTEDPELMRAVLSVVKKRSMFFLDSRTTPDSVADRVAREVGVKNADRNVFLDNTRDGKYIKGQIMELVSIARKRGKAIGIGHPYPETIEALKENISILRNEGINVVKLSELVE